MKSLLLSLISCLIFSSLSFSQIVNYDITIGSTIGLELTSGDICTAPWVTEEAKQISVGNSWGGSWTSINGGTPTSVQVELRFTVTDDAFASQQTTFNGLPNNNVSVGTPVLCASGPLLSWSLDPSNYNSLGVNTFTVNSSVTADSINQIDNLPYAGDPYLRVIVNYSPCTPPSDPTITAVPATLCVGDSSTISVVGTLNDATEWFLYSGSCGGTLVDQNATGMFNVAPLTSTTYYVRGEGGCVTPGTCSSVFIQSNPFPINTVSQNGSQLTANAPLAAYQWLDCDDNFAELIGETNQVFNASLIGNYAVLVLELGCADTSSCYPVTVIGLAEDLISGFEIYPNPATQLITIDYGDVKSIEALSITNSLGQIIYTQQAPKDGISIDISKLTVGIYTVEIDTDRIKLFQKFIKE